MELTLLNGPYTRVIAARAEKSMLYLVLENSDPNGIGIQRVDLTIDCGSSVLAADWLSYMMRDLDYKLVLQQTFRG